MVQANRLGHWDVAGKGGQIFFHHHNSHHHYPHYHISWDSSFIYYGNWHARTYLALIGAWVGYMWAFIYLYFTIHFNACGLLCGGVVTDLTC